MRKTTFRTLLTGIAVLAASALIASPAFAQKTKLTVYTALENDQLGPYKEAFEKANPDVEIAWVRDSTGVISARILAGARPQGRRDRSTRGGGQARRSVVGRRLLDRSGHRSLLNLRSPFDVMTGGR